MQGNDTLRGNALGDKLEGFGGNDKLFGNGGTDTLLGSSGSDKLTGGLGRDSMTGGGGGDDFIFLSPRDSGRSALTRDIIKDFVHGADDIDLSAIDANGSATGSPRFKFLADRGDAFTGVKGEVHWLFSGSKTIVEADIDGNRRADFQIELTGHKLLTSGDFVL